MWNLQPTGVAITQLTVTLKNLRINNYLCLIRHKWLKDNLVLVIIWRK